MPGSRKNDDEQTNQAAENGERAARAGADIAQSGAETVQQVVQSGLHMAAQVAERSLDQFERALGFSGEQAGEAAQQSTRNIGAIAECSTVLAHGLQDISREWLNFAQDRLQKNLDSLNALLRCRTPQDLVAVQSELVRDNLEGLLHSSRRVSEISAGIAQEAVQKIAAEAAEAEENSKRARRAA